MRNDSSLYAGGAPPVQIRVALVTSPVRFRFTVAVLLSLLLGLLVPALSVYGQEVTISGSASSTGSSGKSGNTGSVVINGYARRSAYARSAAVRTERPSSQGDPYDVGEPTAAPQPAPTTSNPGDTDEAESQDADGQATDAEPQDSAQPSDRLQDYRDNFERAVFARGYALAGYDDAAFAGDAVIGGRSAAFATRAIDGYSTRRIAYRPVGAGWSGFNSGFYCLPGYERWYGTTYHRFGSDYEYPAWYGYSSRRYECFPSSAWYFRTSFGSAGYRYRARAYHYPGWGAGSRHYGLGGYLGCGSWDGITIRFSF